MLTNESVSSPAQSLPALDPFGSGSKAQRHATGSAAANEASKKLPAVLRFVLRNWRNFLLAYFVLLHVIVYFSLLRTQTHHVKNAHINSYLPGFVHESKIAGSSTVDSGIPVQNATDALTGA